VFAVGDGMLLWTIVRAILTTAKVTLKIANKKKTVMWVKATLVFKSVTGIIDYWKLNSSLIVSLCIQSFGGFFDHGYQHCKLVL